MKIPNRHAKPELLAPAGDSDSLEAALKNGADAVYLGVREFNARVYAPNFSLEELGQVISTSHRQGVKVYLTMNILVKNEEIGKFFNLLSRSYALGIDGVIIQHPSFLEIIQRHFPGLGVFISTQAAIGNRAAVNLLRSASRIILPRELSLAEIRRVTASGVPTEVFIHGALCYSYSGLCLFSSFVGSRSGNRGSCAQLCRQKYNGSYPLSTRELCAVRLIPELLDAGVSGFKIEGRMRSPLYVAVATRLYRKAIDSALSGHFTVPQKELGEIEVVFNREFTEGFLANNTDLVSPEKPMNRGAFLGTAHRGLVTLSRPITRGDGLGIWTTNGIQGFVVREMTVEGRSATTAPAGAAVGLGIGLPDGARVYLTSSPTIHREPDFTLRRTPLTVSSRPQVRVKLSLRHTSGGMALMLLAKVYSLKEAREAAQAGADTVFYNVLAPDFPGPGTKSELSRLGAYLPRIMDDDELDTALRQLEQKRPCAVLCGNLGFLNYRARFPGPVYLDYSLNAFNDQDLAYYARYQSVPVLSPELSLGEMVAFKHRDAVIFAHGDIVLMNTLVEPGLPALRDERGALFPIRRENRYWQILNSRPFGLFNDIQPLMAAGFRRFLIDKESDSPSFITLYRQFATGETVLNRRLRKHSTAGHLYRPVR
jgi:collagenase-like PrtC family protease